MSERLQAKVWHGVQGRTRIEATLTIWQLAKVLSLFGDIEMDGGAVGALVREELERTYGISARVMKKAVPHRVNEKPSEWIARREKELSRKVRERFLDMGCHSLADRADDSNMSVAAILDYLDAQHEARKAAEERYAETEPELPYE